MFSFEEMDSAILNNELFLEYIPTIDLKTGECTGAEALVRWCKDGHIVPPSRFIPQMEHTVLSGLLTYWLVEQLSLELSTYFVVHPRFVVSINVPPEILGSGGVVYAARKCGLDHYLNNIMIEITERGGPNIAAIDMIKRMRARGVHFAMDDVHDLDHFNTSWSARCPINCIKLDSSLVVQICSSRTLPHWLNQLKDIKSKTDLVVIAEGVETKFQADVLKQFGVDKAQGFYFSAPLKRKMLFDFHQKKSTTQVDSLSFLHQKSHTY